MKRYYKVMRKVRDVFWRVVLLRRENFNKLIQHRYCHKELLLLNIFIAPKRQKQQNRTIYWLNNEWLKNE